jgi:putative heme iron utilization protein
LGLRRRKWHNTGNSYMQGAYDLDSSSNIIRFIKSRKMRWVTHVTYMGGKRNIVYTMVGWGNMKTMYHFADLVVEGREMGASGSEYDYSIGWFSYTE